MDGLLLRLQWESTEGADRTHLHSSLGCPDTKSGSSLTKGSLGEGFMTAEFSERPALLIKEKFKVGLFPQLLFVQMFLV